MSNSLHNILIVDDDDSVRRSLARSLERGGYSVIGSASGHECITTASDTPVDAILLDLRLPDTDGLKVLQRLRADGHQQPVLMISGDGTIDEAMRAVQLGATDFLQKPITPERVLVTVKNALRLQTITERCEELEAQQRSQLILGRSRAMRSILRLVEKAAPSEGRVLITGPNGTGKELVASAIHAGSPRANQPLVKVNCAAIPHELIESDLFGHEKGAFTGATAAKRGRFERAHGGTLFLDEIGELPLAMQPKLLRVLQEGELERVGGTSTIQVDVRIIAATNRDLVAMVSRGLFREDLYYRLAVIHIAVPGLSERSEDIPELARYFFSRAKEKNSRSELHLSTAALSELQRHGYPGNVRELQNVVERLVILAEDEEITAQDVQTVLGAGARPPASASKYRPGATLKELVDDAQRLIITEAIEEHEGNVTAAARALGVERSTLYKKCKALGFSPRVRDELS